MSRRPSDARGLLHYYAMLNLKCDVWSSVKSYPVDSKVLSLMPDFPKVDGFRITPITDAGFTDYHIEYDV